MWTIMVWSAVLFDVLCILSSTVIMLILITTIWTFCFTRRVIFNIKQQHSTSSESRYNGKHVYMRRIKKLVGVFGMMLARIILIFLPGLLVVTIEAVVGGNRQSTTVFTIVLVLYLLNSVLNPTIQSYFRREMCMTFLFIAMKC